MKEPIVIRTSDPDQTETITKTVWHCTKPGHPGMLVYTQKIALDKMGEGFDVEIGSVIRVPRRAEYLPVEHDGGTVHALNLSELDNDRPLWRNTPVCGIATGVSSDEAGPESVRPELQITCWECLSIIE